MVPSWICAVAVICHVVCLMLLSTGVLQALLLSQHCTLQEIFDQTLLVAF